MSAEAENLHSPASSLDEFDVLLQEPQDFSHEQEFDITNLDYDTSSMSGNIDGTELNQSLSRTYGSVEPNSHSPAQRSRRSRNTSIPKDAEIIILSDDPVVIDDDADVPVKVEASAVEMRDGNTTPVIKEENTEDYANANQIQSNTMDNPVDLTIDDEEDVMNSSVAQQSQNPQAFGGFGDTETNSKTHSNRISPTDSPSGDANPNGVSLADTVSSHINDSNLHEPATSKTVFSSGTFAAPRMRPQHSAQYIEEMTKAQEEMIQGIKRSEASRAGTMPEGFHGIGRSVDTGPNGDDDGLGADEDDNEEAAAEFAQEKKKYESKRKRNKNTWQDDVRYLKAENAETTRIRRLEVERLRVLNANSDYQAPTMEDDDESLFLPRDPQVSLGKKRVYATATGSDDEETLVNTGQSSKDVPHTKRAKIGDSSEKQQRKDQKQSLEESMKVGLEHEIARMKRLETKGHSAQTGKSKRKPSKKSRAALEPGQGRFGDVTNMNSLLSSNVFSDTRHGRAPLLIDTATKKSDALKALIATMPEEHAQIAKTEKNHILLASRTLGRRQVLPDGNGAWTYKPMKSHLTNHQILGSAWQVDRETGSVLPHGGIHADHMGLGKTVMMIATMISNKPPPGDIYRTTLIVANSGLVVQWENEIHKHCKRGVLGNVVIYRASSRLNGSGALNVLRNADVIITTYNEVMASYPKFLPPKDLLSYASKEAWWHNHYEEKRGLLHRMYFWRVVLDEAQAIKNHKSQTSIAARGLMAKNRWAMSGTPIQNTAEELYPYFKFLRVPFTGTFDLFKENFCDIDNDESIQRLQAFLRQFMIRRTHSDTLFGAPLIVLPPTEEHTTVVDFSPVERRIYEMVRMRYIKRINQYQAKGTLEKSYSSVLTMLLRLRQLTAHVFLIQEVIEDLFEYEDVESLWQATASEDTADGRDGRDILTQMRNIIAAKGVRKGSLDANQADSMVENESEPLIFKFRKYLKGLATGLRWEDLQERSRCHRCEDRPEEPYVTSCLHLYCKECLETMVIEAAQNNLDQATCLQCGEAFTESRPCEGIRELESMENSDMSSETSQRKKGRKAKDAQDEMKWIDFEGRVLPSTKITALVAQIERWLQEDPESKIVVFTQFLLMIRIVGRICHQRKWGFATYHGKMDLPAREKNIDEFGNMANKKILIMSLKAGGIGLNLTMANKVICIDLWWNHAVEQQAFCRIYRIGQTRKTYIERFIVRNTVDEKLQRMQEGKQMVCSAAMGDDESKRLGKLSLTQLMHLFGTVQEDENHKEFIIPEDECRFDEEAPPLAETYDTAEAMPPPPFRH